MIHYLSNLLGFVKSGKLKPKKLRNQTTLSTEAKILELLNGQLHNREIRDNLGPHYAGELAASFLQLDLPSKLIRHENVAFRKTLFKQEEFENAGFKF